MTKLTQREAIAIGAAFFAVVFIAPTVFGTHISSKNSTASSYTTFGQSEEDITARPSVSVTQSTPVSDFTTDDLVPGHGVKANFGDRVYVHYVGMLESGKVFDTSTEQTEPFKFTLGDGDVILGWELGIVNMREGGTRRITVPSDLAYGGQEVRDASDNVLVPAHSNLIFDIVLLRVDKFE